MNKVELVTRALHEALKSVVAALDLRVGAVDTKTDDLTARVATLETSGGGVGQDVAGDLAALDTRVSGLDTRVTALEATGGSGGTGGGTGAGTFRRTATGGSAQAATLMSPDPIQRLGAQMLGSGQLSYRSDTADLRIGSGIAALTRIPRQAHLDVTMRLRGVNTTFHHHGIALQGDDSTTAFSGYRIAHLYRDGEATWMFSRYLNGVEDASTVLATPATPWTDGIVKDLRVVISDSGAGQLFVDGALTHSWQDSTYPLTRPGVFAYQGDAALSALTGPYRVSLTGVPAGAVYADGLPADQPRFAAGLSELGVYLNGEQLGAFLAAPGDTFAYTTAQRSD